MPYKLMKLCGWMNLDDAGPPRPVLESCAWVRSDIHLPCQNWEEQFRFVDRGSETMTKYACQVVRSRRHSSDETPD